MIIKLIIGSTIVEIPEGVSVDVCNLTKDLAWANLDGCFIELPKELVKLQSELAKQTTAILIGSSIH